MVIRRSISMGRIKFVMIVAVLCGGGFVVSNRFVTIPRLFAATDARHEFTATLLTTAYNKEGQSRTQEISTYAVRKDGSNVRLRKGFAPDGSGGQREVE